MKSVPIARYGVALFALLLSACTLSASGGTDVGGCQAGADAGKSAAGLDQITLCVSSGTKTHKFTTEIARSSMEQAKGMMFRTEMADNTAMLFPFPEPKMASFWMKNTVIPLDIIFIRSDGSIESIAENAVPYSTTPVESGEPVTAVLELRGGLAAELGIGPGDKVHWKGK